jgi:hypothetical protein
MEFGPVMWGADRACIEPAKLWYTVGGGGGKEFLADGGKGGKASQQLVRDARGGKNAR